MKCNFLFCLLVLLILVSCSKRNLPSLKSYQRTALSEIPDYSDLQNWAAHPWKWDPSDSIPLPLREFYSKDSIADVFFLYPTSLTDKKDTSLNASINNAEINRKTDYSSILYQASAFNEKTRVFSPRYRQANLSNYFSKDTAASVNAFDLAYTDIKNAFVHYLKYYNNGRGIVIASHSQGTNHAQRLLKEFFENKPLQSRLICAYLIGMPVPENYFTYIPSCKDSVSIGCFVTWRTYKKGSEGAEYVKREKFKSVVTNPLIWNNTSQYASASLNKGGILLDFNKVYKEVTDAMVYKNILWSRKPRFFGSIMLRTKNYHIADINLFYLNIHENVRMRINSYQKTTP